MFTGLIQDIGEIVDVDERGDTQFRIKTDLPLAQIPIGASICCSGCCLTVTEKDTGVFTVDVSAESLSRTNLGSWAQGTKVNLEPSLKMGDELGGHFVFGHVDGVAKITAIEKEGDSHRLKIKPPADLMPYIASKGSVALDGISLTVNEVEGDSFGVNIIPHTWEKTTLAGRKPGDHLNIEIDMLARYVARQLQK